MVSYYNSLSYPQKHHPTNLSYPTSAHQAWFPPNYHPHSAANQQFLNGITGSSDHATHLNHQHQAAAAAAMYYNSHMFHQAPPPPPTSHHDLYGARDNFQNFTATSVHPSLPPPPPPPLAPSSSSSSSTASSAFYHATGLQNNGQYFTPSHFGINYGGGAGGGGSIGSCSIGGSPLDETSSSADILTDGIPSPPNTTGSGGSGINSPGVPNASSSPHLLNRNTPMATSTPTNLVNNNNNNSNNQKNHNNNNNSKNNNINIDHDNNNNHHHHHDDDDNDDDVNIENKMKIDRDDREYYDWMKKPSYPSQPNPGKTRTKDKYRVVYSDYQRLELEKEYHTSRYITIRRKTELAQGLQLSERQVKIWFQNRRAKERKQTKKRDDPIGINVNHQTPVNCIQNSVADDLANFLDIKPKTENIEFTQTHNTFHSQLSSVNMGPPPPPPPPTSSSSASHHNLLNTFSMLPPPHHVHQAHHLSMSPSVGQNGMISQPPGTLPTNLMQHSYSQMLQNMIEPIP